MTGYVIFPHAGLDTSGSTPWLRIVDALAQEGHRPILWLGAHRIVGEAARRFPDCTFLSGKLLRSPHMEEVVRGLSAIRMGSSATSSCLDVLGPHAYESLKLRAAAMLGRTTTWPGPDRLRSRLAVVSLMMDSFWGFLQERRPTGVVSAETPFSAPTYLIWELAGALGVPRIAFENVKQAPLVFGRTDVTGPPSTSPDLGAQHDELREEVIDAVVRELLAADDRGPQYVKEKHARERAHDPRRDPRFDTSVTRRTIRSFRAAVSGHRSRVGRRPGPRALVGILRESLRRSRHRAVAARAESRARHRLGEAWHAVRSATPDRPHVLLALGYEHEKHVLPDGDVSWHQTDVVLRLRRELPDDVELVVREHPNIFFASEGGHRGRTAEEYRLLAAVPGIVLADDRPLAGSVRAARLVCSVKGMAPLWGLAAGRPGLVFADPWFAELPGITRYRSSGDVAAALTSSVPPAEVTARAIREVLRRITFVGINSPEFRGRYRAWASRLDVIESHTVEAVRRTVLAVLGPSR